MANRPSWVNHGNKTVALLRCWAAIADIDNTSNDETYQLWVQYFRRQVRVLELAIRTHSDFAVRRAVVVMRSALPEYFPTDAAESSETWGWHILDALDWLDRMVTPPTTRIETQGMRSVK